MMGAKNELIEPHPLSKSAAAHGAAIRAAFRNI
jgi:hypothetical protein